MKGIVVTSHGGMATGIKETLSMFFGKIEQAEFLSLASDEEPESFFSRLSESAEKVDTGDGTIIFTDMFGGTPNNCACRLLDKYDVVSGYNLPMLMIVLTKRMSETLDISSLIEESKESMLHVNLVNQNIEEDDF